MKLSIQISATVLMASMVAAPTARGAYVLSAVNVPVTEQFTDYPGLAAPENWTLSGVTGPAFNGQNNGSSFAGGFYSYGTDGSPNRSLGYLGNNGSAQSITNVATFENSTGVTVSAVAITFVAQQWHGQLGERIGGWQLSISTDGGSNFDPVSAGDLSTWVASNTLPDGPVDGHTHASTRSGTVTGLSIANGASFLLRWSSNEGTGSGWSQGIAIDNVSVSAVPEPPGATLAVVALITFVVFTRRGRWA